MDALLELADINFGNPAPPQRTQASLGAADPWGAGAQPQADPWGGASASMPTSNMGALAALAAPPTSSSGIIEWNKNIPSKPDWLIYNLNPRIVEKSWNQTLLIYIGHEKKNSYCYFFSYYSKTLKMILTTHTV